MARPPFLNLLSALSKRGLDVLLIDADPQGSVLQWQSIAGNRAIDVIHRPQADIHEQVGALSRNYQHIIIDAPPATGEITRSILLASRLAIVPIGPSPLDIWSSRETVDLVKKARKFNRKLTSKLLVCKKIIGTRESHQARDALKGYRTQLFKTEIAQRIVYARALVQGLSVVQYEPRSEAASEIRSLCSEILKRKG